MGTLATLLVKLGIDSSDYQSGIGEAEQSTGGLRGALSNVLQLAGGFGLGTLGVTALGKAFHFAKDAALGMNADLEKTTLQFTTLMGNSDAATAHVKGLFEFAKATPFETQPVIEASKMMFTFGGAALATQENLTMVGDAAAATGNGINDLGFWTGRMYAAVQAGQPFGEAAGRLQELAVLSPVARAEMENLQKTGASADQIWGVFSKDLGKFTGAMETQAGTWEGLTATIMDTLQITMAQALQPFFGLVKEGMSKIAGWLSNPAVGQAAQAAAQSIADGLKQVVSFITDTLIPGVTTGLAMLNTGYDLYIAPFVDGILSVLGPLVSGVTTAFGDEGFAGAITYLLDKVATISPAWNLIWGTAQAIFPAIQSIVTTVFSAVSEFLSTHGADIMATLSGAWTKIQEIISSVLQIIQLTIVPVLTAIAGFISQHKDLIVGLLTGAWEVIKGIINGALTIIQGVINTILALIKGDWEGAWLAIQTMIAGVWEAIKTIFGGALTFIENLVATIFAAVGIDIKAVWNDISTFLTGLWDGISTTATSIWKTISDAIDTALKVIHALLDPFIKLMSGDLEGAWKSIKETATTMWEAVKTAIGEVLEGIKTWVNEKLGALEGIVTGMGTRLYDAGRAILNQLWDGMKSIWDDAKAWFEGAAQEIADILPGSEPKDPQSPLTALAERGTALIENMMKGLDSAWPKLMENVNQGLENSIISPLKMVEDRFGDSKNGIVAHIQAAGLEMGKLTSTAMTNASKKPMGDVLAKISMMPTNVGEGILDKVGSGVKGGNIINVHTSSPEEKKERILDQAKMWQMLGAGG